MGNKYEKDNKNLNIFPTIMPLKLKRLYLRQKSLFNFVIRHSLRNPGHILVLFFMGNPVQFTPSIPGKAKVRHKRIYLLDPKIWKTL